MTVVEPPEQLHRGPGQSTSTRQPALGLLGLVLVVPIAAALAVGAGPEGSVRVLGPIVTYALPLVVMVAFWWANWPGARLRASWAGWADTALIAVGGIVLTALGQTVAGHLDPAGMFDPSPGPGHVPTYPATMPLGGAAFVAMLQFTLVGEGWPLRRMHWLPAGALAVAFSWIVALVVYLTLVDYEPLTGSDVTRRHGSVPGADFGAALTLVGAWQVLCYVIWRGWPFASITSRAVRLTSAHVIVLGGGILTYLVGRMLLGLDAVRIAAVAGCFIAAALVFGMLLEDWLGHLTSAVERAALLLATLTLTALLAVVLEVIAEALPLTRVNADDWVEHASLNALSVSVILHVAIGRRWPFVSRRGAVATGDALDGTASP
jgi:hypothetical protein